jgi:zinc transport system substrate-binding protein
MKNGWRNGNEKGLSVLDDGSGGDAVVGGAPAAAAERLVVYAVNYPLQYFAQRIAGDYAEVVLPVPTGVDPAFWQPDAAGIGGFQRADVILLNGAGYAK